MGRLIRKVRQRWWWLSLFTLVLGVYLALYFAGKSQQDQVMSDYLFSERGLRGGYDVAVNADGMGVLMSLLLAFLGGAALYFIKRRDIRAVSD